MARAYGAQTTPDVFVIDADGRLRYRGAPDADHNDPSLNAAWLREALDALLAGEEPGRPETAEGLLGQMEARDRATTVARPAEPGLAPGSASADSAHRRGGVAQVGEHRVGLGGAQLVEVGEAGGHRHGAGARLARGAHVERRVAHQHGAGRLAVLAAARSRAIATSS